jgi:phosphoribosyl 1,2-cyclic phosphate phosphodiesterase
LIPHISFQVVDSRPFRIGGTGVQPIPLRHGRIWSTGYRIGGFAYLTDTSGIPASSRALLRDLDTLVIDSLRWEPHPTHLSIPEALEVIADLRPHRAYLTHLSHALEHNATNARLANGVQLAYDGLRLEIGSP